LSTYSSLEGLDEVIAELSRIISDLGLSRHVLEDVSTIIADLWAGKS
jgi:transcription initiation factor TFIIIB Brf1 subunit/transcription initiation factor TFIIB